MCQIGPSTTKPGIRSFKLANPFTLGPNAKISPVLLTWSSCPTSNFAITPLGKLQFENGRPAAAACNGRVALASCALLAVLSRVGELPRHPHSHFHFAGLISHLLLALLLLQREQGDAVAAPCRAVAITASAAAIFSLSSPSSFATTRSISVRHRKPKPSPGERLIGDFAIAAAG